MHFRILDLRHFNYALAAAEHGSFRRAAAALNVQQSTVSRGVRSLEHQIGAELFERGHAGIQPTSAGDQFLKEAALALDHLEHAAQRIGALQHCEDGELAVGACAPLTVLGNTLEQFREAYGGISVKIVETTSSASSVLIQHRKLDVAFVARPPAGGSLRSLHLRDERMIALLPKLHPLAGARELVLEDLRDERIILSAGGLGPDIADDIARRVAKSEIELDVHLQDVGQFNLITMVASNFGVTIVLGLLPLTASEVVAIVPIAGEAVVPLHAVWMESNPNPALRRLLHILRNPA